MPTTKASARAAALGACLAITILAAGCTVAGTPVAGATFSSTASSVAATSAPDSSQSQSAPVASSGPEPTDATESTDAADITGATDEPAPSIPTTPDASDGPVPAITVDTASPQSVATTNAIKGALLKTSDFGPEFVATPQPPPNPRDTSVKLTCGQASALTLYPNTLGAGTTITKGQSVQFQQDVDLYFDAGTAAKAYAAEVAGLSCTHGTNSVGTPVDITATQDVTAQVGGTHAQAWQVNVSGDPAVLIFVSSGRWLMFYAFISSQGTDTSTLPTPIALAKEATARILALKV